MYTKIKGGGGRALFVEMPYLVYKFERFNEIAPQNVNIINTCIIINNYNDLLIIGKVKATLLQGFLSLSSP
jgi:hypothetical protein